MQRKGGEPIEFPGNVQQVLYFFVVHDFSTSGKVLQILESKTLIKTNIMSCVNVLLSFGESIFPNTRVFL